MTKYLYFYDCTNLHCNLECEPTDRELVSCPHCEENSLVLTHTIPLCIKCEKVTVDAPNEQCRMCSKGSIPEISFVKN